MTLVLLRGGLVWRPRQPALEPADLLVRDGRIAQVAPRVDAPPQARVVDVTGQVVLPGLVEAHCHLDKTLYGGPWVPHSADDTLAGRIGNDLGRRAELGVPSVPRVRALLERMIAFGTAHVRTHTDIDPQVGLRGVEAVREAAAGLPIGVRQVAFPQHGVLTNPGTAELLEEALQNGVEAVGGIDPAGIDRDPVRHLDVVFGLAERYGAHLDIHLHDGGTLGGWELELIIERTRVLGLGGRVAVSHAYALGQLDDAAQGRLIDGLADAGVALVTAAVYSFPVPPVKRLRAAGVTLACGHDGIRDLWGGRTAAATCWSAPCISPTAAPSAETTTSSWLLRPPPRAAPACSASAPTAWPPATAPTWSWCRAGARRRPWSFTLRALWS
ncbi:amidohydrolase family protein [Nonomuraea salmonea]|uniref:amidohydrolase family protein n=1 Tax=Nonomuraea salmonea TaxID=46181 RepID=UPI0031E87373